MSHWHQAWLVAGWEFRRYFKWKDQLLGLALMLVFSGLAWGVGKLVTGGSRAMTVAVSGIELQAPAGSRLRFTTAPSDSTAQVALLDTGDVSGVLSRDGTGAFVLLVEKDPRYFGQLQVLLADVARRERLAGSGLSEGELARILSPPDVSLRFTDPDRQRHGRGERLVAGIVLGLVMLSVLTSMAYLLTGITGEKQLRVTESITSIIRPQAWIDGKILGIGGYALSSILTMVVGGVILAVVASQAWGFRIPALATRPTLIIVLFVYAALALGLWNSAFAAFASTIDDPNTSARTSIMFLPFLPVSMSVSLLRDPDHISSRVLAMFPLTSPTAMPIRVILSNPGFAEIAASIILLVGMIWLFRRLAGRIFEVGMLMYGKEPSLAEMWRWARTGRA
jgi:ABC-2 type transport system permease protein